MEPKTMGERVKIRRLELGLTQGDVAKVAGVSEAAVSQWESGNTKNLKNDHLFSVADLLNLAPRYLATGKGPREAANGRVAYKEALTRRDEEKSELRTTWEKVAAGLAKTAAIALLAIPPLLPNKADASFNIIKTRVSDSFTSSLNTIYIVFRWLQAFICNRTFLNA